jgi:hypothetical protein
VDLVKIAILVADCVGYAIVPLEQTVTLEQILEMLPASARTSFHDTPEAFRTSICERIRAFVRG